MTGCKCARYISFSRLDISSIALPEAEYASFCLSSRQIKYEQLLMAFMCVSKQQLLTPFFLQVFSIKSYYLMRC